MPIPPNNSLTYWLAFVKTIIEPTKINFEEIFEAEKSKEKMKVKIIEIKTCSKSRDKKDFIQDLKNILVFLFVKQMNANGEIKMNILIRTYLIE